MELGTRFKQAMEASLFMAAFLLIYFCVPFVFISFIDWNFAFADFIKQTQMGMSIPEFIRFIIAFMAFFAGIGFLVPTSTFGKDYVVCRWWR